MSSLRSTMGSVTGHRRIDSGVGTSNYGSGMGSGMSEKFGRSGITLPTATSSGYLNEKALPEQPLVSRGIRNPFLMDNTEVDDITPVDVSGEGGRSRPVRNRLLDDTSSPPSYDEAAAETQSRRFGRGILNGGLFSRDRERDSDRGRDNEMERGEKSEAWTSQENGDHERSSKKGWWGRKGKGIRGRFSLGLN